VPVVVVVVAKQLQLQLAHKSTTNLKPSLMSIAALNPISSSALDESPIDLATWREIIYLHLSSNNFEEDFNQIINRYAFTCTNI